MTDTVDRIEVSDIIFDKDNQERRSWVFCGKKVPRSQALFFVQVFLVLLIVVVSITNLTIADTCEETTVWVAILSSSVGYVIPAPKQS